MSKNYEMIVWYRREDEAFVVDFPEFARLHGPWP